MRKAIRTTILMALALVLSAGVAAAAEIRILSVGAVQVAIKNLAEVFTKETGNQVNFTIGAPAIVQQRLASGEAFDAIIQSVPAMEALDQAGGLKAGSRLKLARTGIGVAVRDGGPVPDISNPDAFKAALAAAHVVVYGDPAQANASGALVVGILTKAGVIDEVKPKARIEALVTGLEHVAQGDADIALFNISEIPLVKGVKFAGPVPGPLQAYTNYEAAVLAKSAAPDPALAFVKLLAGPGSQSTWKTAGLEAPGS